MKISNDVRGGSEKIGEGGFQCEVWSGVEWSGVESATKTTRKRDSRATVKRKRKKKETRKGKKKNKFLSLCFPTALSSRRMYIRKIKFHVVVRLRSSQRNDLAESFLPNMRATSGSRHVANRQLDRVRGDRSYYYNITIICCIIIINDYYY